MIKQKRVLAKELPNTFGLINTTLTDKEIVFLYNLTFAVEDMKRNKNTKGFSIKDKQIRKFLKDNNVSLDYKSKVCKHEGMNKILFSASDSTCFDFLRHIRNAFSHGLLIKEHNYILIKDFYQNKLTMYGKISRNLLFLLIDIMINTKK